MIGYSKKNRENYPSECFSLKENETRISANHLSNNWALIFYVAVRKFVCVHREAQKIFMGVNTKYRANLVETRVNVPITCFTYTGSVSMSYF